MTDFQRWAMAAIIQAYQKEIQPPDGSIRGVRRQVFLEAKNKLVASFWVHEISFNGVYLEEERNKAKFTNYPYHAGDYKFRTEGDQTGEGDYSWVRIHNRNLDETYIQGQTESVAITSQPEQNRTTKFRLMILKLAEPTSTALQSKLVVSLVWFSSRLRLDFLQNATLALNNVV